jgi:beta-1,2-mannobiose phosphorylase / 1,2-beta-oligomannan phosphorylase
MIKFLGTAQRESEVLLYFHYAKERFNFCKVVTSKDGLEFNGEAKYVIVRNSKKTEEKKYDWQSFRISKQQDQFVAAYKPNGKSKGLKIATSPDLLRWETGTILKAVKETGVIVPDYTYKGDFVMYHGERNIKIAYSHNLQNWSEKHQVVLEGRKDHFDHGHLEVGNAFLHEDYILLLYYVKKGHLLALGACLFDKNDPTKLLWRSDEPLWEQEGDLAKEKLTPLGAVMLHHKVYLYWQVGDHAVYAVSVPVPGLNFHLKDKTYATIVKKYHKNPILSPRPDIHWDSRAAFNSAAIYEDGKVHFLYRALGDKDLSVLGYATSSDGMTIDHRSTEPVYIPREPFETPGGHAFKTFADHFVSGGGYGGIEDPRITKVDDRLYLTYVAFDGANPPRAAMSSIHVDDFLNKKWGKWSKAKLISAPGMVNKSAVILPKKVNGKYVVLHRVYPNILVDYLDDLEFNEYLTGHHFIPPRKKYWDSKKVGAGAPPMETKDGWLMIYQSVGYQDPGRYKIGAMMLDRDNPSKVLYRTNKPIIEPVEQYENGGFKAGVVYPCGAVIMNDRLNIYYGGSDSFVCGASADINKFLDAMKHNQEPKLDRVRSPFFN